MQRTPFPLASPTSLPLSLKHLRPADALREAGVPAWVQVWDGAMHMFQLSFDVNPDARKAVAEIVDFFEYATTAQPGEVAS